MTPAHSVSAQPITFLPFANGTEVHCVQGNNGAYSHTGSLRYSYDFDMGSTSNNSSNPVYGLSVYAPFTGLITDLRSGIVDFQNNSSSNSTNHGGLGNTIQLQVTGPDGQTYFARFAHLKNGSIPSTLRVGDTVSQGQRIGQVGQTGYSTSPHLHMQVTTTQYGSSVQFNFVEGPVSTGTYIRSQLESNKFIVDNDGRATLGHPISSVGTYIRGTWSTYSAVSTSFGSSYRGSTSTGATFRWQFSYRVPSSTNMFRVLARCPNNSNRDQSANYTVSVGSSSTSTTIDQRYLATPQTLGYITLGSGTSTINVSLARSRDTTCADGLILYGL
jgi:hypothetical protein